MLDRRLDETGRARSEDCHVALLGVDRIEPRRLIVHLQSGDAFQAPATAQPDISAARLVSG